MKMEHLFKMLKKINLIFWLFFFYNDFINLYKLYKDFLYVSIFTTKLLGGEKGDCCIF